jgi:XTP/dITP diphosphohydrolase
VKQILVATHNKGKLAEFALMLEPLGIAVISAEALALPEPDETALSFAGNAQLKAIAAAKAANMPALADDSGISIVALDNGPGIFSARYAAGDYPLAFAKIIAVSKQKDEWRARFTCALCLAQPDGTTATYIGHADGLISKTPSGTQGFGYDPIFMPIGYDKTYAELGADVKDKISHRAKAFEQLAAYLER